MAQIPFVGGFRGLRRFTVALSGILLASLSLSTAAADYSLRQFDHMAWRVRDGAPSEILALAQTRDGFLWVGTANGLFRFDGARFELYRASSGETLPKVSVASLAASPDGGLWVGYTLGGGSFIKEDRVTNYEITVHGSGGTVWYYAFDADGSVWAACAHGVSHFVEGAWHDVKPTSGFDAPAAYRVFEDAQGNLWVTTDSVVYEKPKRSDRFVKTAVAASPDGAFEQAPNGTLWLNDDAGVRQLFTDGTVRLGKVAYADDSISDLRFDQSGGLWAVSLRTGVARIVPAGVEHFTDREGLTANRGSTSLRDREGTIWVGTPEGLDRFRLRALAPAPLPSTFGFYALAAADDGALLIGTERDGLQRLSGNRVARVRSVALPAIACLLRGPDGRIWIGGTDGLGYLDQGRFTAVPLPAALLTDPAPDMQAMAAAANGDLWIQKVSNTPIMRLHGKTWSPITATPLTYGPAVVLRADHRNRLWAGFMGNRIMVFTGEHAETFGTAQGLDVGNVTALYESDDRMWAGGERGMAAFVGGKLLSVAFAGDEAVRGISGIIAGPDGSLWVNSITGVLRIDAAELAQWSKDRGHAMRYRLFNYLDGLSGKAPQLRPLPSAIATADGRLWFTTTNGAVSIDPRNIPANPEIPPVAITAALADGKRVAGTEGLELPRGMQNLEFDYAALSFVMPERVRVRYRLEGFDRDWQESGSRRQAFYPHLPPGQYRFHVIAANNDGLWNEEGASVPVSLPPTFLQSPYFKALVFLAAIAAVAALYWLRLRQATEKARARILERFLERERIARDLHDTFFQNIQGLLLGVQAASRQLPGADDTRVALEAVLLQSDRIMAQGRELVLDLRTPSTGVEALATDLRAAGDEFSRGKPVIFSLAQSGRQRPLNDTVAEELHRLGREAIGNAVRHAHAGRIEVLLSYGLTELRLTVCDDGCGIDPKILAAGGVPNHWGMPGMKERAAKIGGRFSLECPSEGGTQVDVRIAARRAYRSG